MDIPKGFVHGLIANPGCRATRSALADYLTERGGNSDFIRSLADGTLEFAMTVLDRFFRDWRDPSRELTILLADGPNPQDPDVILAYLPGNQLPPCHDCGIRFNWIFSRNGQWLSSTCMCHSPSPSGAEVGNP